MAENNPISRTNDLVVQEYDGEVLIYDLKADKALCLNEAAATVWRACDGTNTVADIATRVGSEDLAWLALNDLKKQKLIVHEAPNKLDGVSRREVIQKIGVGTMLAIPVIAALAAPTPAQSGSCVGMCGQTLACPTVALCMCSNNSSTNNGTCGV